MKRRDFDVNLGNYLTFWNYLETYQNAFNVLYEDIKRKNVHVDGVAYPMLFIARHSLELGFKANIRYFKKYSEIKDFTNFDTHNLIDLFNGFKLHINVSIKNLNKKYSVNVDLKDLKEFKSYCVDVEQLINQFDLIDSGSYSFRYPFDKKNKKVFDKKESLNIMDIKEVFDKSIILLFHTSDFFSKYTDYADSIESSYEEEMQYSLGHN